MATADSNIDPYWRGRPQYTIIQAAYLTFVLQPNAREFMSGLAPDKITDLGGRLYRDLLKPDPQLGRGDVHPPKKRWFNMCVDRQDLIAWFNRNGWADLPSFLGESDRESDIKTRERETLLKIIAALAKAAKIDISKPSKAADQIELLTIDLGARVSARTVENHLKRIHKMLEKRATP